MEAAVTAAACSVVHLESVDVAVEAGKGKVMAEGTALVAAKA